MVHVVADVALQNDTIRMSSANVEPLPNGWATFVHGLSASSVKGNVALDSLGFGRWLVHAKGAGRVRLTYDVGVAHDSVHWSVSGAAAHGYLVDGTLFFVGRAMFITGAGTRDFGRRVHFVLPNGWSVATPYAAVVGARDTYEAKTLGELWANGNLVGPIATERMKLGKLDVLFAGGPSMKEPLRLYRSTFTKVIGEYVKLVGPAPAGQFVVISNMAPAMRDIGGESFENSIITMVAARPDSTNRARWSYVLAHEAFHHWNPQAFPPAKQEEFEWFVEGFTDYMTRLVQMRTGITTEAQFQQAMSDAYDTYAKAAGKLSLKEAGKDKGSNYNLIYFGGTTLAVALDAELKARSGGKVGVPELMQRLYADYARTGESFSYDGFVKTVSALAGSDMAGFLGARIMGTEAMPRPEVP